MAAGIALIILIALASLTTVRPAQGAPAASPISATARASGTAQNTATEPQLPPDKAARASAAASFLAAAASDRPLGSIPLLTPFGTVGIDIGIPAGDGEISPDGAINGPIGYPGSFNETNSWWTGTASGAHVIVWAGASATDFHQGLLVVGSYEGENVVARSWLTVKVPASGGAVKITGAKGKVLTIVAANGSTHTFDSVTGTLS
jgi:hypothetical protein